MKSLLLMLAAPALLLAVATKYPVVQTPKGITAMVVQVDAGICGAIETYGLPCGQHVTVMLFGVVPTSGTVYQVTITYAASYGPTTEVKSFSKRVTAIDEMPAVVFLISNITVSSVLVEVVS